MWWSRASWTSLNRDFESCDTIFLEAQDEEVIFLILVRPQITGNLNSQGTSYSSTIWKPCMYLPIFEAANLLSGSDPIFIVEQQFPRAGSRGNFAENSIPCIRKWLYMLTSPLCSPVPMGHGPILGPVLKYRTLQIFGTVDQYLWTSFYRYALLYCDSLQKWFLVRTVIANCL